MKKCRLIIIEGPSGSGKSTIAKKIKNHIEEMNFKVGLIPEFSKSKIGKLLEENSKFGEVQDDNFKALCGILLYINDKVSLIKSISNVDCDYVIADRFITTQLILGLPTIKNENERAIIKSLICDLENELVKNFKSYSAFNLNVNLDILINRLTNRTNKKLNRTDIMNLTHQIEAYEQLNTISKLSFVPLQNNKDEDAFLKIKSKII